MQMTVDGFVAGPNGEQDWMQWDWDRKLKEYVEAITDSVDTIVLGRKLAEGFIPYWADVAEDPDNPERKSGKLFTELPKVVFTKTLDESKWENATLAKGDLVNEITKLKKQEGGDIIAYGGATFVSNLIKEKLIDEFHLFVNPAAIGKGMTIFKNLNSKQHFSLIQSTSFDCGIVVLQYEPTM
jgi:dihydrofolate reductase